MTIPGLKLTTIPRGYESQRWRVSLCIDVDLPDAVDQTLADYSVFTDWPHFLNSQLTYGDQLSQQFSIDLSTQQDTPINVSNIQVHPPDSVPFTDRSEKEKYWSTGWRLLFPSNIPVSPPTPATANSSTAETSGAIPDRLNRTFLSYDPVHVVYQATQAMLNLGRTALQARVQEQSLSSRNPHQTRGPQRQDIQKQFADFKFFLYENDSAFDKYEAQLAHDKIFNAQQPQEEEGARQRLISALGRIQTAKLDAFDKPLTILDLANARPVLTAQTYEALAKYYGYSGVANVRVGHPRSAARTTSADPIALAQALLYHTPGSLPPATLNPPPRSFEERLLILRHQPSLRKLLGLILDISFQATLPPGVSTGFIKVEWKSAGSAAPLRTAFEQWTVGSQTLGFQTFFMPASLPLNANTQDDLGRFPQGLLNVKRALPADAPTPEASSKYRYALGLVEASGTFFKAQQDAQPAGTSTQANASNDEAAGLAAQRSTGLALFDRRMTANAKARQLRDQCLSAAVDKVSRKSEPQCTYLDLYAEDLLLGVRPDIAVANAHVPLQWIPLATRNTRLEFLRISGDHAHEIGHWKIPPNDAAAEGFVSPSSFNDGGDTKAPPELFRYYNFGLGVELSQLLKEQPPESVNGADLELPIRTVTSARSKSFAWLRYQQKYWVRARAAFLDGSGLSATDLADKADSRIGAPTDPFGTPIEFLRTRQIGAPTVLLEGPSPIDKRQGESLTTIVKRTGGSPFEGEALSRVLVPPPMSPSEVYDHGKRMVHNGNIIECLRFSGDEDTWPAREVDIPAPKDSKTSAKQRFPYWSGALTEYRPGDVAHAFLPDILAATMEITITSGPYENQPAPDASVISLQHFRNGTEWPFFRAVTLEMHSAQSHQLPVFKVVPRPNDGRVEIYVRPGAKVNVEAQYVADPSLFLLGQQLVSDFAKLKQAQTEDIERHWLLSQTAQLTLVHAVPEPIERPRFTKLALKTPVATDSTIELDGEAAIHWASTGKVEIWAKWEDPVDDPSHSKQPGCESHEILVQSFDIPEQPSVSAARSDMPTLTRFTLTGLRHAIGDFKHHRVTYGIRGVSRYTSFFPPPKKAPAFDWANEDTRELNVPNRAQLDPLAPLHVIPLVHREFASDHKKHIVRQYKRARYLRLYFSRAFYSSGEGELVGLVFPRQKTENRNTENSDLYGSILGDVASVWGQAPTWKTTGRIIHPLSPDDFPGIQSLKELVITVSPDSDKPQDQVDLPVAVAGFHPWYDTERELWCCDFPLPRRTVYRPLVRLTLVRYQPDSCDKLHVSSHVSTAFSSVMPDRLVTVQRLKHHGDRHEVTMYGTAPLDTSLQVAYPDRPERTILELRVEERPIGEGKEFSWTSIPVSADPGKPNTAGTVWEIQGEPVAQQVGIPIQDLVDDPTDLALLSMWKTTITIARKFAHSYRLTVREREDRLVESPAAAAASPVGWSQLEKSVAGRYVYVDEIPL